MFNICDLYEEYQEKIKECEKIKDVTERANALLRAEESFDLWMDMYPQTEPYQEKLYHQKVYVDRMEFYGLNPKTPE